MLSRIRSTQYKVFTSLQRASFHSSRSNAQKVGSILVRDYSTKISRGNIVQFKGKREGELGDVIHSKNRPFLIVSSDLVTREFNKIMLTPLSTAPARLSFEVVLPANMHTGLNKPSKVMTNQVFTIPQSERTMIKIGSALQHLPLINEALKTCFGNSKISEWDLNKLIASRGDLVDIDVGGTVYEGVVVSNDLGNLYSRVAMIAHSTKLNPENRETKLEIIVQLEDEKNPRQLYVQCHTINTFAKSVISKKGKIREVDMIRISKLLHLALGIVN